MSQNDTDVENGQNLMTIYDKNTLIEVAQLAYLNLIGLVILTR